MKKYLLIASAALLALAACSKVTPVEQPDQAISFNVVNYAQSTKADTGNHDNHGEFTGSFGTYAWFTPTNWATEGTANPFMTNLEISKQSGNTWQPATAYYWPKSGYVTFASYAPYTAGNADGFTSVPTYTKYEAAADQTAATMGGFTISNYTIVQDVTTTDETTQATTITQKTNVDVMYADLAVDMNPANTSSLTHYTAGVPTLFHHVLTKVNFQFALAEKNPTPSVTDCYITLKSAKIVRIDQTGSFAQNFNGTTSNPSWTTSADAAKAEYVLVNSNKELKIAGDALAESDYKDADFKDRMLLPQTLTTAQQQLVLDFDIYTKYGTNNNYAVESFTGVAVDLTYEGLSEWKPNQSITYKVKIVPYAKTPIVFDPAVVAWDDVNGALTVAEYQTQTAQTGQSGE